MRTFISSRFRRLRSARSSRSASSTGLSSSASCTRRSSRCVALPSTVRVSDPELASLTLSDLCLLLHRCLCRKSTRC